ncbi:DNA (cytosine-5-)-methyltransferase [Nitrosomonadales bacterium]|nr:DNA (cytosine-5-)-methyltransferase [Nitrosomonadales bacterium]
MKVKFIDLFAGLGGIRIGFEEACKELGMTPQCVFTSEIKKYAVEIYKNNFDNNDVYGDITQINEKDIPDFDYLLGGFPCQAFSVAGTRKGFKDARGTLFFDIARIIKEKEPNGFLLENVEGLVSHDKGRTLETILNILRKDLDYIVEWKVLNSSDFGVPQNRKRIYIVGKKKESVSLENFTQKKTFFGNILDKDFPPVETKFTKRLLEIYTPNELEGKSIKDKRGGKNNIHSWDLELKGKISKDQKELLSTLLLERRKKKWAIIKNIKWMDGMALTLNEIHSFYSFLSKNELKNMLNDLVDKKYLSYEHPKDLIDNVRVQDQNKEKGYNIVTGKLSFEFHKILDKNGIAPAIVATEVNRFGVIDNNKIRRLTEKECLRLFGFPEWYSSNIALSELYDLIGNTVVVPVIKAISRRILKQPLN